MSDLDTAHKACTPDQLAAYTLAARGVSQRTIALTLGISRAAVRDRLENARRNIALHQRKDTAA